MTSQTSIWSTTRRTWKRTCSKDDINILVCACARTCLCPWVHLCVCVCACVCVHVHVCMERERRMWPVFTGGCKLFFLYSDSESSERLLFLLPKQNYFLVLIMCCRGICSFGLYFPPLALDMTDFGFRPWRSWRGCSPPLSPTWTHWSGWTRWRGRRREWRRRSWARSLATLSGCWTHTSWTTITKWCAILVGSSAQSSEPSFFLHLLDNYCQEVCYTCGVFCTELRA